MDYLHIQSWEREILKSGGYSIPVQFIQLSGWPQGTIYYRIAGNFRWVQIFAIFADRPASAKIKTAKKYTKIEIMTSLRRTSIRIRTYVNEMVLFSLSAL